VLRDCFVRELLPEDHEIAVQTAESWFTTLEFATLYGTADRAIISSDDMGVRRVSFYSVERCLWLFRKLRFVGPMRLSDDVLRNLMAKHNAEFVSIPFLSHDALAKDDSHLERRFVRQGEDFIINLPGTMVDYMAGLGRQTRKHLPYYERRLRREWGARIRYRSSFEKDIDCENFKRLVQLNGMRMKHKGSRSAWTERMVKSRWMLATKSGLLSGIYLDGRLAAGTLCYLHRGEAYLVLIGHDPAHDSLNLGSVSLLKTIEQLIEIGCVRLHLLWGQSFYKRQFGGTDLPLFEVSVFGPSAYALPIWRAELAYRTSYRQLKRLLRPAFKSLRVSLCAQFHKFRPWAGYFTLQRPD
jgi:hypothetical protein